MIDPSIWTNRAAITIRVERNRALDRGVKIDDLENVIRSMQCPFDPARGDWVDHPFSRIGERCVYQVWLDALDARFAPNRRRKGRAGE